MLEPGDLQIPDDKKLLQSFLAGDESPFASIYNLYSDRLLAYALGLGFEQETIKDAIHDIFYKLYFNRKLLNSVNNLRFYLFRMLKNRLLDIYKLSVETNDISQYEMSFSIDVTILDELVSEEDKMVLRHRIKTLLDCLTDRQREAVYLRYMQELDYEEIATLLNMTPQAARKLIFRAMERMRAKNIILFFLLFSFPLVSLN